MSEPTALSLLPPFVVLVLAIQLRRPILALVIGACTGLFLISANPLDVLDNFAATSLKVMQDETIGWLLLVCGGFGSLIALLIRAGGAFAFGERALLLAKGRRSSLLMTSFLGLIIFIDDYLNALTVGETMKRVTDKLKISREMLAYVVDSTAAPICVLVPLSTWAVFFGGLLESDGEGSGIALYIQAIPYMFYAWLTLAVMLLVIVGAIPLFGPMARAEARAMAGHAGQLPEPAQQQEALERTLDANALKAMEEEFATRHRNGRLRHFLLPLVLLVGSTLYFEIDIWKGLLVTLLATLVYFRAAGLMTLPEAMEQMVDGFKTMLPAVGTVMAAFIFKEVSDQLQLPQFVIDSLLPYMSASMLPALVFLAMALLAFATGSSWGIFAVSIPIVMPLAHAVGADIPLTIGALLSASSFGSQACFYSDSTVLAAQGSGCDLISHAVTQLPYALIAAVLTFIGFVLIG
ncbi:Na+/H+ antiporter NhaC family protein [Ferrimonas gelatinilytica]|uniref:Na+/H+ antiporter NhaC family protein n=1 Tax=Ferrimonas gelatinilytica TaxID=1255257 RepID=A0ABP9SDF7_9GAMM